MNHYRTLFLGIASCLALLAHGSLRQADAADLEQLELLGGAYPRAFFFRSAEGFAANPRTTYERWEESFSRLSGIIGKTLDEEVLGRERRNIDFFTRFKKQHSEQAVLLHLNGNARDPRYHLDRYFAGHFIYYNGAKILSDVPAASGETTIRVDDPTLFRTGMGRYRTSSDDIGLCMLDAKGRPDWHRSEQVQLVSIDRAEGTITVRRGCYGTAPMTFPAGEAYAAAHMTEGPWGKKNNIMWFYNYSTACPRDAAGRTCADVWVEELGEWFGPGGKLAAFDGLEFDVLNNKVRGSAQFGADCNADGVVDQGVLDGVNTYGRGVVEFCRALRAELGENRLIMADGMSSHNQRAFGILNGIESEGWPHLSDHAIHDWSGGLNRHFYWDAYAREPKLNYINHKFTGAGDAPGERVRPEVPFSTHRLVFAAGIFTDAAICYSFAPPKDTRSESIGVWDELRMGVENRIGWLGQPAGPAVRLAKESPKVLESTELDLTVDDDQLRATIEDVPTGGPDLFVTVTAKAAPHAGQPAEAPRVLWVGIAPPDGDLIGVEPPRARMQLRGQPEVELDTETGAGVRPRTQRIGDRAVRGYQTHPPYKGGVGYTAWQREVRVPTGGRLELVTAMGPLSPEKSDGVDFRVYVDEAGSHRDATAGSMVFKHSQKAFEFIPHTVSLAPFAGRRVRLSFVADCGPHDKATTDHAFWGDVVVVGPEGREGLTRPVEFMGWAGREPYRCNFYFRDVRSDTVDLDLRIEGTEPATIESVTVRQAADAIYRVFENGIVLANPAAHPYTFDLTKITPNVRYRRLQGSPAQDPITNNGKPVGDTVTLAPMDAVFLVKQ